jgi:hypothetical protein
MAFLAASYGRMPREATAADLTYRIHRLRRSPLPSLSRDGRDLGSASDPVDLVRRLDNDLVLQLQTLRPDLLFVHSAVLGWRGRAVMLVAPSGGGKSTTAWALLHHGFTYLSDELGPVDVATLRVHPYPRALSLKRPPGRPCGLPRPLSRAADEARMPVAVGPARVGPRSLRLGAVFFLSRLDGRAPPAVRRLPASEAAARLYVNALNPLAHPRGGLDPVVRIAGRAACFELRVGDLPATCALVSATVRRALARPRRRRKPATRAGRAAGT